MEWLKHSLNDIVSLFFPNLCLACGENLPPKQEMICVHCQYKLPRTGFHEHRENPFTERFWGRLPLESGAALFHFIKGGKVQRLVHQLKYKDKADIGIRLGQWYGRLLSDSPLFHSVDTVIPVPLHPKKEHLRGYNQAAMFAKGLADAMQVNCLSQGLRRNVFTETQTRKSRLERVENVTEAFEIARPADLKGRHVLLVDDIITTGATLEACGLKLLEVPGLKLSMATIGFAG
ncbi:MAG: ComF family protein [Lewinellaceae bacterium]|nr:ComF family protein [Lewinellaceae bacterium]